MTTNNKDFRVKNGLVVEGSNATVNGVDVATISSSQTFTNKTISGNSNTITLRVNTSENWSLTNPTLSAGEIGLETDTLKFKVGNGSNWNSITAYANVVPSDLNNSLNGYVEVSDIGAVNGVVGLNADQDAIIPGMAIIFEGETSNAFETTLEVADPTQDRTITLPNVTGTVITTGDTGTVTNTMLAGSIANDKLSNSAITINGISTSLGGSRTLGTDDISEGSTNKYFSNELAQDAIGNSIGNGLDYDDNTGAISVDPSEFAISAVGAPTGNVDFASYKITNLGAPTSANDAANKAYVDNTTAGLNFHAAVHVATTANLTATYANGTGGVGATLTGTGTFPQIDGHTINETERILVKNQSTALQNGIYVLTDDGDPSGSWILTRATDADNSPLGEVAYGDFCFIQNGGQAGFGFIVNTTGTITIGTTAINYVQFNAGQVVVAGNGLTETTPGTLAINTAVTVDLNTAQSLTNKTITGTFTGNLTGNADTVTNGVVTTGSYANPSWITSLAASKVGLGDVENTALSTWAGSTNITTLGTISSGTWSASTIATTKGGTGLTSYVAGDIVYASATNTLSKLAAGTNGQVLTLSSGLPVWATSSSGSSLTIENNGSAMTSRPNLNFVGFSVSDDSVNSETDVVNYAGLSYAAAVFR